MEQYRYILYTDGQKSETCSNNINWIKEFIDKIFNPSNTIFNKKRDLCEVLDTKTNTIAYSMTLKQWKEENIKEEINDEFTIEQLKAIKSLERAFKKCKEVNLMFYTEGDSLMVQDSDNEKLEKLISTSQSFVF
jgi:hypothetical protein